jgi:two-component system response regulator AtoC
MEKDHPWQDYLIAGAPAMRSVVKQLPLLLNVDSPVLIYGATGCGKNHLAETIHKAGRRRASPFVVVNCGAMMKEEIGIFATPMNAPLNPFRQARAGTLFLDEIQDATPETQRVLIRILQQAKDSDSTEMPRLMASSSVDLTGLLAGGRFREDLYFRLNVFELELPLLRDRQVDIVPMAKHFIEELGNEPSLRGKIVGRELTSESEACLCQFKWPGNVRELRNVIERAVLMSEDRVIRPNALGMEFTVSTQKNEMIPIPVLGGDLSLKKATRTLEERFIKAALEAADGNRTHAAKILELSHRALLYKMKEYGLG